MGGQEPGPGPQPRSAAARAEESRSCHPQLLPGPVPVKLLVELVPVTLQGVRWETWGQQG